MSAALDSQAFEKQGTELCKESIATHSKSFAMASRLFSRGMSERAAIVYAWCRRADDAIDETAIQEQPAALAQLRRELDGIYGEDPVADPELASFQRVVRACALPRVYCEELLLGMQMDCEDTVYRDWDRLLLYCHRVAGVVGLMMCHVMGLRDADSRRNATHMGLAMQLTNISRDVSEDWERGRLYIPEELLEQCGAPELSARLGEPFPSEAVRPMAQAVQQVLERAESFYRSGDQGLLSLPWRAALAVRSARLIYSRIGARVRAQDCDVTRGRAYVSKSRKLGLVARALASALLESPRRMLLGRIPANSLQNLPPIRFPEDVL